MISSTSRIQLVIFDWAGTTIDFGSCAPAIAFQKLFQSHGVEVTEEQVRKPMGLNKREHLVAMLTESDIATQWKAVNGRVWTDDDVSQLYAEFVTFQMEALKKNSQLVPGLLETAAWLRSRDILIGSTTGYFREAADTVLAAAQEQGFVPEGNVCAQDVSQGRPAPWMIYEIMHQLQVYPSANVLKVGDTVADIEAGQNAGCWSIGVCDSSSLAGLSFDDYRLASEEERTERRLHASKMFRDAGSHAVIDSISDLPRVIEQIDQELAGGNLPHIISSPAANSAVDLA